MPVIAVGAALYAGATIATVGIAAMSTMAVISAVGAIAAGIGVVTGNESLTKIGGIAALVGGVGAFAQGQGWLSGDLAGGADAAGVAADAAAGGAEAVSNTGQMLAEAAPGVADPSAGLSGSVDPSAANYTNAMDVASDAASAGSSGAGAAAEAAGGLMNTPLSPLVAQDVGSFGNVASVNAGTSTSSSIFDTLKTAGSFLKDNKEFAALGLNFVGGMFDDKKKSDAAQAEAAAGLYGARTQSELLQQDQLRQQMANANAVPDLTGLKINPAVKVFNTGAPPAYTAPRVGLINSTGR